MGRLFTLFFVSVLCFVLSASASETDAYTFRYTSLDSGIRVVNEEVNRRIGLALENASAAARGCEISELEKQMKKQFLRPLYGKVEAFINESPLVPKLRSKLQDSVYRYVEGFEQFPGSLGVVGLGFVIRHQNWLLGSDKFGHFFDEGFEYYSRLKKGESLSKAMEYGEATERGIFGSRTTGVESFGDLVANYEGAHFWSELLIPFLPVSSKGQYLKCLKDGDHKKWVQVREFQFEDYLNAGWDEGINCSRYKNSKFETSVLKAIQELELKDGRNYHCPVIRSECAKLRQIYGPNAVRLLGPGCN